MEPTEITAFSLVESIIVLAQESADGGSSKEQDEILSMTLQYSTSDEN